MDACSLLRPFLCALLLQAARLASAAETPSQNLTYQVGDTAIFVLKAPQSSSVFSLLWRSSSRGSMEVLAVWRPGEPVDTLSPHYSKRVAFSPEHWALEIHNLSTADGGSYEVVERQDSADVLLGTYNLVVFNITTSGRFVNGSCSVSLLCEAGAGAGTTVEYSWNPPGWKGSALHLILRPADKDKVYTCTASALSSQYFGKVTPYKETCSSATRAAGGLLLGPLLLALLLRLL